MEIINIRYIFTLPDKTKEVFNLRLDAKTLKLLDSPIENLPSWTRLDFHQCPHCPLIIDLYPDCQLSVNLVNIVDRLGVLISYDQKFTNLKRNLTQAALSHKYTSSDEIPQRRDYEVPL